MFLKCRWSNIFVPNVSTGWVRAGYFERVWESDSHNPFKRDVLTLR